MSKIRKSHALRAVGTVNGKVVLTGGVAEAGTVREKIRKTERSNLAFRVVRAMVGTEARRVTYSALASLAHGFVIIIAGPSGLPFAGRARLASAGFEVASIADERTALGEAFRQALPGLQDTDPALAA